MTEPTASPDVTELLLCPFCGGNAKAFRHDLNGKDAKIKALRWGVGCLDDDCGMDTGYHILEASAIAAWNRRAPDLALRQEVERLTRDLNALTSEKLNGWVETLNNENDKRAAEWRARARKAEASLRLATQGDVVETLRSLVAKLDECQPHIGSAFAMQQMRSGVQYSGPTYADELEAARAALQPKEN